MWTSFLHQYKCCVLIPNCMRVCFLAGSAVTALWQNTDWRVLPRGGALHAGWPGRPQRWRWHQCALLLSWHDPERPRALREREGGRARETKEMEGRNTKEGQSQRETQQIRNWEGGKRGREGMEGKIVGDSQADRSRRWAVRFHY